MVVVISTLILWICIFIAGTVRWLFDVWVELSVDEILYQLSVSSEGTNRSMIMDYLLHYLTWEIIAILLITVMIWQAVKKKHVQKTLFIMWVSILFILSTVVYRLNHELDLVNYWKYSQVGSNFIEENYVNPDDDILHFPEKKRNLIYIYLESMEMTYSSMNNGGGFALGHNVIPELTQLALDNECFSNGKELNGGFSLTGSTWTMGAMFAQSTGIPLKVFGEANSMETKESFYPGAIALGDILAKQGYKQELVIGSTAEFGGRKLFYEQHGNFKIFDYHTAVERGYIPEDYFEFWGFEDAKLFEYAKNELLELAGGPEPFNLTMLTVDTHFEDGYVCNLCGNEYGNDQYANVMACSSRQVADFVKWIQEQDFYENTTVILSGDHLTMDGDFCNSLFGNFDRRTYLCILNSAKQRQSSESRSFSTMDMFPTTLSSLGVEIDGDKLGLGVDLYSETKTLVEQYGKEECDHALMAKSDLINKMAALELTQENFDSFSASFNIESSDFQKSNGRLSINAVSNTEVSEDGIVDMYIRVSAPDCEITSTGKIKVETYRERSDGKLYQRYYGDVLIDPAIPENFVIDIVVETVDDQSVVIKSFDSSRQMLSAGNLGA